MRLRKATCVHVRRSSSIAHFKGAIKCLFSQSKSLITTITGGGGGGGGGHTLLGSIQINPYLVHHQSIIVPKIIKSLVWCTL